jgi:hypothetical protein
MLLFIQIKNYFLNLASNFFKSLDTHTIISILYFSLALTVAYSILHGGGNPVPPSTPIFEPTYVLTYVKGTTGLQDLDTNILREYTEAHTASFTKEDNNLTFPQRLIFCLICLVFLAVPGI